MDGEFGLWGRGLEQNINKKGLGTAKPTVPDIRTSTGHRKKFPEALSS